MKTPDQHLHRDVSIIIPTKGRHESVLRTVNSLLLSVPEDRSLEIIVIEETDRPRPIRGERVKYFSIPERGLGFGYARNLGLRKANGSIIIFIDDDILPSQNWFENLTEPLKDEHVGAVGGAVLPDLSNINTTGKCISFLGFPAGGLKRYVSTKGLTYETNLLSSGNSAFRADFARSVGGFDELLGSGEDQEFFARISAISRTLFVPSN